MKVRGAYMTLKEFLFTYRKGAVYTENADKEQTCWNLNEKRKLVIPDYQREYRWGEKQLTELINDIENSQCYLGQIAVSQNLSEPQKYDIIDGQQRITSIIILYTVLVRQLVLQNDTLNVEEYDLHIAKNNKDDQTLPRLCFSTNCFSDFQAYISQIYNLRDDELDIKNFESPKQDDYLQQERYVDACKTIQGEIKNLLKIKGPVPNQLTYITDFLKKVLATRISLVVFESGETYESERVFLDINEKGLRLDNEDILKAYYFQKVPAQYGREALKTWIKLKKAYLNLSDSFTKKIPLESFVSIALQTELMMSDPSLEFNRFDSDLRYKTPSGKKHICELFVATNLHKTMKTIVDLLETLFALSQQNYNSEYYKTYFSKNDSTTRNIFTILYAPILKSGMIILYIPLIKIWWLRNKKEQHLTKEDIIQLFSFYIISNVSGVKKERILLDTDFTKATDINEAYRFLHLVEIEILSNAASNSTTLRSDQEKGEYLSFNIQMFYNDFRFNQEKKEWTISLKNQDFLDKYSSNRKKYIKDHFIIQNGNSILLINGELFTVTQRLKMIRKRAYNFIYHYDDFENIDFISRMERIFSNELEEMYGNYELEYFAYIKSQLMIYFDIDNQLDEVAAWEDICEKYSEVVPVQFDAIVSTLLEVNIVIWNQHVCNHFSKQFPSEFTETTSVQ